LVPRRTFQRDRTGGEKSVKYAGAPRSAHRVFTK
jgi:hypothetical protein